MISTRCAVPTRRIRFCSSSRSTISLLIRWPTARMRLMSAGSFASALSPVLRHDDRLDLLVAQDRAQPAAAGLLDAHRLAPRVVPAHVEAADAGVLAALARRHDGHVALVAVVPGVQRGELLGKQVRVDRFLRRSLDRHAALVAVDEDDDLFGGLALHLERVPARRP